MILSAQTIRQRITNSFPHGDLMIVPFYERRVYQGMSYGLSACGYDIRIKDEVAVPPHGFVLAVSVEYLSLPHDLRATLADKSTWARRGIAVQNTRFEPGWRGYPTIEISNHGDGQVVIPAGAPIGQMEFAKLDQPTELPYSGKYQDQPQVPVGAIEEKL